MEVDRGGKRGLCGTGLICVSSVDLFECEGERETNASDKKRARETGRATDKAGCKKGKYLVTGSLRWEEEY